MKENQNDPQEQKNSTGQQQNQGSQANQGNRNSDENSSSNKMNHEEGERDNSTQDQDEISFPEKERKIQTPYAENSTDRNQGDNQNQGSTKDRNSGSNQNC